jgi:hypothetical protein
VAGPLFVPFGGHDCITVPDDHISRSMSHDTGVVVTVARFADNDWRPIPKDHIFIPEGFTLWTLVLDADDGETMFGFTHVLKDARLNIQVKPHEKFIKVGDSGLEPFTQRGQNPAHIHLAIMIDRTQFGRWQGGVGNIRVFDWLTSMGFKIRNEGSVPSPQQYMQGFVNSKPY